MKRRWLAGVVLVAAALSLTGCAQPGGPDAATWLASHSIVHSTRLSYDLHGLEKDPDLTATINPDASDAALEKLADDTDRYLQSHKTQPLTIRLSISRIVLDAEPNQSTSLKAEWAALAHDHRIEGGLIEGGFGIVNVQTARASVVPVYAKFIGSGIPLRVAQTGATGDSRGIGVGGYRSCKPTAAALSFASEALADSAVVSAQIDPCGSSGLAVHALPQLLPLATQLHAEGDSSVQVEFDTEDAVGGGGPADSVAVNRASPAVVALLERVATIPNLGQYSLAEDGSLIVAAPLESAAATIYPDPGLSGVSSLTLLHGNDSIQADSDAAFEPDYALATTLGGICPYAYVTIMPTVISVKVLAGPNAKVDTYSRYGKRLLAAIAGSALWQDRVVILENQYSNKGVEFHGRESAAVGQVSASESALVRYWTSLTS